MIFIFSFLSSVRSQESYYAHIISDTVHCVEVVSDEFVQDNPQRYSGTWKKVGTEDQPYVGIGDIYIRDEDRIIPKPQPE